MPADDARGGRVHAEVAEDAVDDCFVIEQRVERVLHLFAGRFVGDEVQLEGRHLALGEQGRAGAEPQVPQHVEPALALCLVGG